MIEAENARIAVVEKAKSAVLAVFSSTGRGGGSGVVLSPDGFALTNFHVAKPSGHWMKCGMADGRLYDAVLVGLDPTGDVALIQLFGRDDFPAAELGDSDQVQPGDWVFAMGNPFLLAADLKPTVTYGIISGTHRYQYPAGTLLEYTDCLQTDAAINPGNSGGPLFDAQGRLIGVNGRCSFEKRGRVSVGVGYAISINQIRNFLGQLHGGRIVDHATLGARVVSDAEGRVVVDDILEPSDAYRRGLRHGDQIIQFAGRPIGTPNALKNVLGIFPKGWRLPLVYRRKGQRHEILVRLEGVHRPGVLIEATEGRKSPLPEEDPNPEKPTPDQPKPGNPEPRTPTPKPRVPSPQSRVPSPEPRTPIPEVIQKHFEARRGYANYYYNRRHQERVFSAWSAQCHPGPAEAPWVLQGHTQGGQPVRFELDAAGIVAQLPGGEIRWTAGDELGANLAPPESGGLLLTLHLWRRLATEGLGRFGEVYYLGTAPLPGHPAPLDVLVGLHGGVECHFYFDPAEHHLVALEMVPDEGVDPCEVLFSDFHADGPRVVPGRMEVRHGDDRFGVFVLEKCVVGPAKP